MEVDLTGKLLVTRSNYEGSDAAGSSCVSGSAAAAYATVTPVRSGPPGHWQPECGTGNKYFGTQPLSDAAADWQPASDAAVSSFLDTPAAISESGPS